MLTICRLSGIARGFAGFGRHEKGATAIEYALLASLVALALIGALHSTSARLTGEFAEVSSALTPASSQQHSPCASVNGAC